MDPINDARFYESLIKLPHQRSPEDVRNIYEQLRHLDMFQNLYNDPLKAICRLARYERHPAHHILFREGQVATCWYILLSGSVFIADHIYLPYGCFGKRNVVKSRRSHDCLCLQESEMIRIDYPSESQQMSLQRRSVDVEATLMPPPPVPPRPPRIPPPRTKPAPPPRGLPRSYMVEFPVDVPSTSFDTLTENFKSQVYLNGSTADEDTLVRVKHRREKSNSMGSVASAAVRKLRVRSTASSTTTEGEELTGEAGDSEEEDDEGSCPSRESFMDLRDSVRECLEKEPSERNSEDLAVLLDFMQHMSAFAPLPMSIKRQLCLKMVFAVVNDAGTIVMHNNEKLDAWSVLVNGLVEVVKPNGDRIEYKLGDSFGAQPINSVQYHDGEMKTLVDDCEFVLVEHKDFCSIMSTVQDHIERDTDGVTGEVTAEHERRSLGSQSGAVIIKAKADRLIQHLVEERDNNLDPHYVDDFLLTYRVFIQDPTLIFEKLMLLFADTLYRDKVARLILLWVNNHYNDFETNESLFKLLERFEAALEREGMHSQQSLLNIACSVKARMRKIEYSRKGKDARLEFTLVGGKEETAGIFVCLVETESEAEKKGLRRADEIIEINGQSVRGMALIRAEDIIKGSIGVNLTVKSNILGFKELQEKTDTLKAKKQKTNHSQGRNSIAAVIPLKKLSKNGTKTGMMDKLLTILSSTKDEDFADEIRAASHEIRPSRSNPDISSISQYYNPIKSDSPEHVLKIYRNDQTFKYLAVYKETTAQNVVQLALQEFSMTSEGSLEWSLCECTVTEDGVIKQKRLPHQLENLAERISLNSRYYLKNINKSEPLVPDELAPEILKEAQAQLLLLNAQVVAAQLTLQDFSVFTSIEPTEYIDNLFQLKSRYGSPKLEEFERVFNRQMWWVATEVCRERNVQKRAKLVKKFIKIARYCRDLRNFNSMFAIMSGLDKPAVRRLHSTWERVSGKYVRMLDDVQQLVDPSRNMSKYRQHLAEVSQEPPVIPIYPVIKKDLTFSHEGNPTYMDKLVNFEKLRLIAKSVRAVTKLSSAPYEISSMAEKSGGMVNDALLHMNSFENGNVATMRKGGKNSQPRKKIYEQALMVRKVKTYLENMKTIETEVELDRLSYDLEPQQSTTRPRRAASPTPSSVSSHSTGSASTDQRRFIGAKFGVESPQAVQKMFSLVSSSKVKGSSASSPVSTPTVSRGLQRNVPRVTARQNMAPDIQRTPSLRHEPVDLNQETSSVTNFYGKDLRVPSVNVSQASSLSPAPTFSIKSAQNRGPGIVLGHRPIPHYPSQPSGFFLRGANVVKDSSEQISRV